MKVKTLFEVCNSSFLRHESKVTYALYEKITCIWLKQGLNVINVIFMCQFPYCCYRSWSSLCLYLNCAVHYSYRKHYVNISYYITCQALNNLGSVYVDCGELDAAADCYINALKIRHTRAHQGLARVHFLRNDKNAAYEEMTKLIGKARNNASAYEKRSEYCERELTKADLEMVTRLDPLRVYPYRYRAAGLIIFSSHFFPILVMEKKKDFMENWPKLSC